MPAYRLCLYAITLTFEAIVNVLHACMHGPAIVIDLCLLRAYFGYEVISQRTCMNAQLGPTATVVQLSPYRLRGVPKNVVAVLFVSNNAVRTGTIYAT